MCENLGANVCARPCVSEALCVYAARLSPHHLELCRVELSRVDNLLEHSAERLLLLLESVGVHILVEARLALVERLHRGELGLDGGVAHARRLEHLHRRALLRERRALGGEHPSTDRSFGEENQLRVAERVARGGLVARGEGRVNLGVHVHMLEIGVRVVLVLEGARRVERERGALVLNVPATLERFGEDAQQRIAVLLPHFLAPADDE